MPVTEEMGLRDRKKRETRAAIARASMELFAARGFDAVTVADVARSAGVSEKTVFNYFPAKEDLVFARGADDRAALLQSIRELPEGTSVGVPFRRRTMGFLDHVERDPVDDIVAVPRLVMQSPTLRNRLSIGWEQEAAALAPVIAEVTGRPEEDLVAAVVARTLAWTHRLAFRTACRRLIDGDDQRRVAAEVREDALEAYDVVEGGLAGVRVTARPA